MRRVLPTIRPLNINPLHGWEKPRHGRKNCDLRSLVWRSCWWFFFDWQGVIQKEFVPEGETINAMYYKGVMERLLNRIWCVRPGMCESGDWFLFCTTTPCPTTWQSSSSFWPIEQWLCLTTLRIRRIYHLLITFCSQQWNPTWRGVSLTQFWTSRKPWQVH